MSLYGNMTSPSAHAVRVLTPKNGGETGVVEELRDRQKKLLGMIVDTYVSTVGPVGSKTIAQYFDGKVSPATIRNEMHELEDLGYITHPHTSAGRIPTDKGYRYYVDRLMGKTNLNVQDALRIKQEFESRIESLEELIERTSKILASLTEQAGIILYPSFSSLVLKQIDLIRLSAQHILVVWITESGYVENRVIDLEHQISEAELQRVGVFLNQELSGLPLSQIKSELAQKLGQARDSLYHVYEEACRIVSNSFPERGAPRLLVDGSHFILEQPEFKSWEKSKNLIKALELRAALLEVIQNGETEHSRVHIQIGMEHHCRDLWDCSFITTQYSVSDRVLGTLGVLGPRRMPYGRLVGLVQHMSETLSGLLGRWL